MSLSSDLATRLEKVERQNRRLFAALIVMAALWWLGPLARARAGQTVPVLEAQQFLLLDPAGRRRGEWRLDTDGEPWILLYGADGKIVASLPGRAMLHPAR
jgi:hypothetical protein